MTTPPVRVERRVGQRFPYLLPVTLRECSGDIQGAGFTQDLSSRGVFLFTEAAVIEGSEIELTLRMPSEITLGENMRVRCRGRVLRVVKPPASGAQNGTGRDPVSPRFGVAVRFDNYEYLPDLIESGTRAARVSALHPREDEIAPVEPASEVQG
jgi:PilZ domain